MVKQKINPELAALYAADGDDHTAGHKVGTSEYDAMRSRDAARRERVRTILAQTNTNHPHDLYHAAWILNHGDTPDDAEAATRLAERAASAGHHPALWLSAAAYDRWQMYCGLPQRFGTQSVPDGTRYRLWPLDGSATDADRAAHDVPTLRELERRAEEASKTLPQPPIDQAPTWLKDAIARWSAGE
jgi:TPR repeat protein